MPEQNVFLGLNAQAAKDKISNEISAGVNVDFSLQPGAAICRRGSKRFTLIGGNAIRDLYRAYNKATDIDGGAWYAALGTGVYRGNVGGSFSSLVGGAATVRTGFSYWDNYTLIANGTAGDYYKDNGTTVLEWVLQAPPSAPSVSYSTGSPLVVGTVWTDGGAGGGTSTATVTYSSTDTTPANVYLDITLLTTNLATNTGVAMDGGSVDHLKLWFNDVSKVNSFTVSYGDVGFNNYFTYTVLKDSPQAYNIASPDDVYVQLTNDDGIISGDTRDELVGDMNDDVGDIITATPQVSAMWADIFIPRSAYSVIGTPVWSNIQAARVTFNVTSAVEIRLTGWYITGDQNHNLNDINIGYSWCETWASFDSDGNLLAESAPSPPSVLTTCLNAQGTVVMGSSPTGTRNGITHRIIYRKGGLMKDYYAVGSIGIGSSTLVPTDDDIAVLSNNIRLKNNLFSRVTMPGNVVEVSEPFFSRVFVASQNKLLWSLPGLPDCFPITSITDVSQAGDEVAKLQVYGPTMVVVNRDSVYELTGTIFEGIEANWNLYRTSARHGSKAPRTAIKTPQGVPLLDYDGLFMYIPGQGIERPLPWVNEKIGDAWLGANSTDPAARKGNRLLPINKGYIINSWAVWVESKLYLGVPTGSDQYPSTVYVLDFSKERVWIYTYPFAIRSAWWDFVDNRLMAGTQDGAIMQLEAGGYDTTTSNNISTINWRASTKKWVWPNGSRLTDLSLDVAANGTTGIALSETGGSINLGTITNTSRNRVTVSLGGTLVNEATFDVSGGMQSVGNDQQQGLFGVAWEALEEPIAVTYARTEYFIPGGEVEWKAIAQEIDCIGVTTATLFVDSIAVSTYTLSPTGGARGLVNPIPGTPVAGNLNHVYGRSGFTIYTGGPFRHYKTWYETNPEPSQVTHYRTPTKFWEDWNEVQGIDCYLNPLGGVVLGTAVLDGTAVSTYTLTGNQYLNFSYSLPLLKFAKSGYMIFKSSTPFKHYETEFNSIPHPDIHTSYRTPTKFFEGEHEIRAVGMDVDPLGGTTTGVVYVDSTAINTYSFTGSGQRGTVTTLPVRTYGRSAYVVYTSPTGLRHYETWFESTPEPSRVLSHRTKTTVNQDPGEYRSVKTYLNPLGGVVSGTVFIDEQPYTISTMQGQGYLEFVNSLPPRTFGLTVYAIYNSTTPFKHYETWYDYTPYPDSITSYRSELQVWEGEQEIRAVGVMMDCHGGSVNADIYIDGVLTTSTQLSGPLEKGFAITIPPYTYGRSAFVVYSSPTPFRHFKTWFESTPEPSRVTSHRTESFSFPTNHIPKTGVAVLNPLGTCTGTVRINGTPVSTATFTGTLQETFNIGLDHASFVPLKEGNMMDVLYSSGQVFKHYKTIIDTEPKPPHKTTWMVTYRKIGGATQLDRAIFWNLQYAGTATITSIWDVDGVVFGTDTATISGTGWLDRQPLPPDMRGYLFRQRLLASSPVEIYNASLDIAQTGIKGLSRRSISGVISG